MPAPKPLLPGDKVLLLRIKQLRRHGGLQSREKTNEKWVRGLAELIHGGEDLTGGEHGLNPITAFFDGKYYWLAHGFHRTAAYELEGHASITILVRPGSHRDALLYSAGCNRAEQLQRSNEDKQRAVFILLRDPEWAAWKNREIARHCGVSEFMVRNWRTKLAEEAAAEARRRKAEEERRREEEKRRKEGCDSIAPGDADEDEDEAPTPADYEPTAEELANPWLTAVPPPPAREPDEDDLVKRRGQVCRLLLKYGRMMAELRMSPLAGLYHFAPRPAPAAGGPGGGDAAGGGDVQALAPGDAAP